MLHERETRNLNIHGLKTTNIHMHTQNRNYYNPKLLHNTCTLIPALVKNLYQTFRAKFQCFVYLA